MKRGALTLYRGDTGKSSIQKSLKRKTERAYLWHAPFLGSYRYYLKSRSRNGLNGCRPLLLFWGTAASKGAVHVGILQHATKIV